MSIQEVSAEQLAELFHHYYEALAPDFDGSHGRLAAWPEVSPQERSHLTAAVRLALLDLGSSGEGTTKRERYFAKPGEAEWGC